MIRFQLSLFLLLFGACSNVTPYQKKIYSCMEEIVDLGGGTSEAFDVCQKILSGKRGE